MAKINVKFIFEQVKQNSKTLLLAISALSLVLGAYGIQQYEKKQNKSKLENLADENKNGIFEYYEKIKMYNLCGLKDTTEYLSASDLEKGVQNYQKERDSLNKIYK